MARSKFVFEIISASFSTTCKPGPNWPSGRSTRNKTKCQAATLQIETNWHSVSATRHSPGSLKLRGSFPGSLPTESLVWQCFSGSLKIQPAKNLFFFLGQRKRAPDWRASFCAVLLRSNDSKRDGLCRRPGFCPVDGSIDYCVACLLFNSRSTSLHRESPLRTSLMDRHSAYFASGEPTPSR